MLGNCRPFPGDQRTAFWSALVVPHAAYFAWLGLFVSTRRTALTLFWERLTLGLLRVLDTNRWRDWLLLGGICGLGLLSNTIAACPWRRLFFISWPFTRNRLSTAKPWVAAALALAILCPNIFWNISR